MSRATSLRSLMLAALVSFGLPLASLVTLLVWNTNADIAVADSERLGLEYARPLVDLLMKIADHGALARGDEASAETRADLEREIDAAFDELAEADAQSAEALQLTARQLARVDLAQLRVEELRREWKELREAPDAAESTDASAYEHLTGELRSLITHVGDTSALILDPELDSYYLMDLCVAAIPQAIDRLQAMRTFGQQTTELAEEQRVQLEVFASLLAEADRARIGADAATAMAPTSNVRGDPEQVGRALRDPHQGFSDATQELAGVVDALRAGSGSLSDELRAACVSETRRSLGASRALWEASARELDRLLEARGAHYRRVRSVALILTAAAFAASAALLVRVLRGTRRQLDEAARVAREIGAGNLAVEIDPSAGRETQHLMIELEGMAGGLSDTVRQVIQLVDRVEQAAQGAAVRVAQVEAAAAQQDRGLTDSSQAVARVVESAEQIASLSRSLHAATDDSATAAHELTASATELSGDASQLFGSVSDVSESLEQGSHSAEQVVASTETLLEAAEITSQRMRELESAVADVNRRAGESNALSQRVRASSEAGRESVARTLDGMREIRNASSEIQSAIGELAGRAKAIGRVVGMIDDVADDTDLLAFNAAVIAAQQGGQTRAFTVIAGEIKALSKRVFERTKEIEELSGSLQRESGNALTTLERGMASIEHGVKRSQETQHSFETIAVAANESGAQVAAIAAAVSQQATVVGEVAHLMDRVRGGANEIRSASSAQREASERLMRGTTALREVSSRVQGTAETQAKSSEEVRASVERFQTSVASIDLAVQGQVSACENVRGRLGEVGQAAKSTVGSVSVMHQTVRDLLRDAEALRAHVRRFALRKAYDGGGEDDSSRRATSSPVRPSALPSASR